MAQPRLICLSGPHAGGVFPLAGPEFTIGRLALHHLPIPLPGASRNHARIVFRDGSPVLEDLESHNGTFVNSAPIRAHALRDGDEIRIAGALYLFLSRPGEPAPAEPVPAGVAPGPSDQRRTTTIRMALGRDQVAPSAGDADALDSGFAERLLGQLEALRSLASAMVADAEAADALPAVAGLLARTFGAERSCILLWDAATETLEPAASFPHCPGEEDASPISGTVVRKVAGERVSLLCSDAVADERLDQAASVAGLRIRSVMCTPLIHRDRLLGVVYLDSRSLADEFGGRDLWLLKVMADQIAVLVDNIALVGALRGRLRSLEAEAGGAPAIIGESAALEGVIRTARKAADSNATILVLGESGTGKEVMARNIHRWSPRRDAPFVVVNCAALTEQLLQSDLFGHERGAFTGAIRQKRGRLELAEGGTVFLDEIGEIDREMQAKLLRFLQEHEFERLGGTRPIRVDVRVIAASNRDLAEEVRAGRFREDLYYRLRVVEVVMPPLRERPGDIALLAQAFLQQYAAEAGREARSFTADALSQLTHHAWPGNIRELRNCIERAVVLGSGPVIGAGDLNVSSQSWPEIESAASGYHERVREIKRRVIRAALERAEGRQQQAASALGLRPTYLSRLMKNLGMR
ncbi:MAG: sigma 54-interacting transcriptional regulator [Candidatus Eisenbacteria bacterium]|uniref:Sigma 54-interacting transcriptional regulator n=1 Tax=Eiseniibacteriota bacterium TaxID=2212470 RepID=A0A938BQV4_UNCEI|nr:sigma 54-interacting transcriptional regulator [Candidatus Eisenbacteria bacterium]